MGNSHKVNVTQLHLCSIQNILFSIEVLVSNFFIKSKFTKEASPSAVAYIMSQKYVNAMPLYRQEKELEKLDVDISKQTIANWVIRCANDWL